MNPTTPAPQPAIRTLRHDPDVQPFIVIWEVTRACQLVCQHCRADAIHQRNPAELTAAQGLHISLSPSVTPRLTRSTLERLRDAGAKAVSLSLDGATAATHDGFRGIDGVYDDTLDAARMVRELGLRLQVNTTVTQGNLSELPAILRQVIALRAGLWSVFFLVPTGRGAALEALDAHETEDVLHWLHDASRLLAIKTTEAPHYRRVALQRRGGPAAPEVVGPLYRQLRDDIADLLDLGDAPARRAARPPLDVNAGKGFVFVDHVGAVYPSGFLPVPVGSVRDRPITELYREAPLLRWLRDPDRLAGRCGRCAFRQVCGGSRSRAYAMSGDPLGEDLTCSYQPAS